MINRLRIFDWIQGTLATIVSPSAAHEKVLQLGFQLAM